MSQNIHMLPHMENQGSKVIKHITFRYTGAVLNPPQAAIFLMIPISKLSSQGGHAWGSRRPLLSHSTPDTSSNCMCTGNLMQQEVFTCQDAANTLQMRQMPSVFIYRLNVVADINFHRHTELREGSKNHFRHTDSGFGDHFGVRVL